MANYSGLISFLLAKRRDVSGVSSVPRLPAARMNTTRFCGCKGYRSCKLCEDEYGIASIEVGQERADKFERTAVFCLACQNAFMGDRCSADSAAGRLCSSHEGEDPFLSMTFLLAVLLSQSGFKSIIGTFTKSKITGIPANSRVFIKQCESLT